MLHIILQQGSHVTAEDARAIEPHLARADLYSPEIICPPPEIKSGLSKEYRALRGPKGRQAYEKYCAMVRTLAEEIGPVQSEKRGFFPDYDLEERRLYLESPRAPIFLLAEEGNEREHKTIQTLWERMAQHAEEARVRWHHDDYAQTRTQFLLAIGAYRMTSDLRETLIIKKAKKLAAENRGRHVTWLVFLGCYHHTMADQLTQAVNPDFGTVEAHGVLPYDTSWKDVLSRKPLEEFKNLRIPLTDDALDILLLEAYAYNFVEHGANRQESNFAHALRIADMSTQERALVHSQLNHAENREQAQAALAQAGLPVASQEAQRSFAELYHRKQLVLAIDGIPHVTDRV